MSFGPTTPPTCSLTAVSYARNHAVVMKDLAYVRLRHTGGSLRQAEYLQRHLNRAQARYLSAIKGLAQDPAGCSAPRFS